MVSILSTTCQVFGRYHLPRHTAIVSIEYWWSFVPFFAAAPSVLRRRCIVPVTNEAMDCGAYCTHAAIVRVAWALATRVYKRFQVRNFRLKYVVRQ
jgi:hypothetical protein